MMHDILRLLFQGKVYKILSPPFEGSPLKRIA